MKKLIVGSISGIFNQLFSFEQTISGRQCYIKSQYLDLNSWFWSEQLETKKLKNCMNLLNLKMQKLPIKLQWAIQNFSTFINSFEYAKKQICNVLDDPQKLYKYLETLQIACDIFYFAETTPFRLDISSGFIRSSDSAKELLENSTKIYCNPYLLFIQKKIIPAIKEYCPDILWFTGKPNVVTFAISLLIRKILPQIHIGVSYHSSEYYSLNKILPLLLQNHYFFTAFDFVVLHDDFNTMEAIEQAFDNQRSLRTIPNILFSPDFGETIIQTKFQLPIIKRTIQKPSKNSKILNIKLFPQQYCYWNKCSFCGINQKYFPTSNNWDFTFAIDTLKYLHKKKINMFWLTDEAIPCNILLKIAEIIIENNWNFIWHIRTRVENELLNEILCNKLKKAGLKSMLLGFESASERILKLMNKTIDCENYLETAENIVKKYNAKGISIHFPVIIGFPSETDEERERTLLFLEYLKNNYMRFSYNINILELDISSELYKNFAKYNIYSLCYPCEPFAFIGNSIEWEFCNKDILKAIQINSMRKMFKWFPYNSLLEIDVFYKLLEHTRVCFWSTNLYKKEYKYILNIDKDLIRCNENITLFVNDESEIVLFNEDTLNYIVGGDFLKKVYSQKSWIFCKNLIYGYDSEFHNSLITLIQELIDYKILIIKR